MITLRQLRYLASLARHRHFGRAAEDCAVTQPALSMQIRELEREIGADLVERRPGDIVLTDVGIEVAERAEQILTATRDLVFNGAVLQPYLGVTDPIVSPLMKITAFRRTGPDTAEIDWHAEPAPGVLHLESCTNLGSVPPNWTPVATNTLGTINGTLSVTGLVSGQFFRLEAPR